MTITFALLAARAGLQQGWSRESVCWWLRRALACANRTNDPRKGSIMRALNYARRLAR